MNNALLIPALSFFLWGNTNNISTVNIPEASIQADSAWEEVVEEAKEAPKPKVVSGAERRARVQQALAKKRKTKGTKSKITVDQFSDYRCSFCAKAYQTMNALKAEFGDDLEVNVKHFPVHGKNDFAVAAQCAARQGEFTAYNEFMLTPDQMAINKTWQDDHVIAAVATAIGINNKAYWECVNNEETLEIVNNHATQARAWKATGTPFFVINGEHKVAGAQSIEVFHEALNKILVTD